MVRRPYIYRLRKGGCGWVPAWDVQRRAWHGVKWHCEHREECTACGKVLRDRGTFHRTECPMFAGADPAQKIAAEEESARRTQADRARDKRSAARQRREDDRLGQLGKSGFRKKKAAR
jgi:hypothetical protein